MMSSFEPELRPGGFVADPVQPRRGPFEATPEQTGPRARETAPPPAVEEPAPADPAGTPDPVDTDAIAGAAFEEGQAGVHAERPAEENEDLSGAVRVLESSARALTELRQDQLAANRRFVMDLAVAIAEKVIGRAVRTDPEVLASLVERALTPLGDGGTVELSLSSEDHETLTSRLTHTLERLRRDFDIEVRPDPALLPGDVRVGQGRAEVDARIAELLRRVREDLDDDALFAKEAP